MGCQQLKKVVVIYRLQVNRESLRRWSAPDAPEMWQPISRFALLPLSHHPGRPKVAVNAHNGMWPPAGRFTKQPARLPLIIKPWTLATGNATFPLLFVHLWAAITMGRAHLAFGKLSPWKESQPRVLRQSQNRRHLKPKGDAMPQSDSLMFVAGKEGCPATDSPKGHALIQSFTLWVAGSP